MMVAEDDAGLPDAPLFALLRAVEKDVTVERIDRVWVFPARRLEAGETTLVVVAAFHDLSDDDLSDDDRRTVFAAHYTATAEPPETRLTVQEYGTAPAERVGRVVEDVLERLKEEPGRAPHAARIDGETGRWHDLLHLLADRHLQEVAANPRLRRSWPGAPG